MRRPTLSPRQSLALALLLCVGPLFACLEGPSGPSDSTTTTNAVWNCPTATPLPPVTPVPTVCTDSTPGPDGTPGPAECSKPEPTATPIPTATPYGRWLSPGDRGSSNTFYQDQEVRVGALLVRLDSYTTQPMTGTLVAHIFTFYTHNEGGETLDMQWPLQLFVREVQSADGTSTAGTWWATEESEHAAGLPPWQFSMGSYPPAAARTITVAIEAPAGHAHAVGLVPDVWSGDPHDGLGNAAHILWFLPQPDPYCPNQNTRGPPRQGDGGAVYPKPLPSPAVVQDGYFAGWPITLGQQWRVSQGFGCTDFTELSGYDCPNAKPWFHSGIDIAAPEGTNVLSVVQGRVIFAGPSSGSRECTFPGAMPPRFNLGLEIIIQPLDSADHPAPFVVKYGHFLRFAVVLGQLVQPGDLLGYMGSTGCSTGPHTHLMVQQGNVFLNPFNFIGPPRR